MKNRSNQYEPCCATFDVKLAKMCAGKMLLKLFMLFPPNDCFPTVALLLFVFDANVSFTLCNPLLVDDVTSFFSSNGLRSCCTAEM